MLTNESLSNLHSNNAYCNNLDCALCVISELFVLVLGHLDEG